jgi:hypothetical protein
MVLNNFLYAADLNWDRVNRVFHDTVEATGGDSGGRKMRVQVTNNGTVENLTGYTLNLAWKTRDEAFSGLDAFTALDITQGIFEITFSTGMLSNIGRLTAALQLVGTGVTESPSFFINVTESAVDGEAQESSNSFGALEAALIAAQSGGDLGVQVGALQLMVEAIDRGYAGTYASLAALTAAIPAGNTNRYVTTDNGNWYYWNGAAWTSGGVFQASALPAGVKSMADFINLLKGATEGVNLVLNGEDFVDTTGWTPFSATQAIVGSNLVITGTGNSYCGSNYNVGLDDPVGTKYYYQYTMRVQSTGCTKIGIRSSSTAVASTEIANPVQNTWYTKSGGFTKTAAAGTATNVSPTQYYSSTTGKILEVQQLIAVNKTAIYGAGLEPSDDDFGLLWGAWLSEYLKTEQARVDALEVAAGDLATLETVQDEILTKQTAASMDYIFMTDMHAIDAHYEQSLEWMRKAVQLANLHCVDFLCFGGDFVCWAGYHESLAVIEQKFLDMKMICAESRVPVINLHGNHDDNSIDTYNALPAETYYADDFYKTMVRPFQDDSYIHDTQKLTSLYYYKDFPVKKMRLVVLDGCDYPIVDDGAGGLLYSGALFYGYGARQVTWLHTEGLQGIPAGYKVVVLSHCPFGTGYINGTLIQGILEACHAGGTYTGSTSAPDTGVSVSASFTAQGARPMLNYQHGHVHVDGINATSGTWKRVSTVNTSTVEQWDITTIDAVGGKVYFTRVGTGTDREITL